MKFLKQIFGEIESRFDLLNNPLIESFLELKSFQKTNEKRIQSIFVILSFSLKAHVFNQYDWL
jgi:hypothetical protein